MGGANRKTEAERLRKGVNIIIATPGRLLDHLKNSPGFVTRNLLVFCMDEADRILEIGFEDDLRAIVKLLPKDRQTMLFSATQTKQVEDLARLSINPKTAVYTEVESDNREATAENLEQGYVTCASDKRFLLLFTFLKKNKNKKIMVFLSSCNSVKFHAELLNYIDIPVLDIHGRQKQVKRTTTFFQFQKAKHATLLCTDVAARYVVIKDSGDVSFSSLLSLTLHSVMLHLVGDLIFQKWIGLYSLIRQMTQKNTFIALVVQPEVPRDRDVHYCF
jgi:ATP-dependent RNA helicase DDX18/HAS1